jgi:hypothetical protein
MKRLISVAVLTSFPFLLQSCAGTYRGVRVERYWFELKKLRVAAKVAILPLEASPELSPGNGKRAAEVVTDQLYEAMHYPQEWDLIPRQGVLEALNQLSASSLEIQKDKALEVAREVGATGILFGRVYRYRERQGTDSEVKSPASVRFVLTFLDAWRDNIVWEASFDETQERARAGGPDLYSFSLASRSPKWLTVQELSLQGANWLAHDLQRTMYAASLGPGGDNGIGGIP